VKEFGLQNVVFALGDSFLEVVSPIQPGTAGGRYLDRHGDGGYMLLFDVRDLEGARARAAELGVRVVWQLDLPDISGTHLHPGDIGGAIVSIDRSEPYGTWRWGGPQWTGRTGAGAPLELAGVTVTVPDPSATAERWGEVLNVAVSADAGAAVLELDGGEVRFQRDGEGERLTEIALRAPGAPEPRAPLRLGGVTIRFAA
jgi:hypothetical protein